MDGGGGGGPMLAINGERQSGEDVRVQNVTAVCAVANVIKSSLGPVGLDKMLVDDLGDVTITNDGATILKQLEVEHPAAKILVELAELQDEEVGDGTTSVVIVASELLKRANELVRNKVHPTTIISGYRLAMRESCKFIEQQLAMDTAELAKSTLNTNSIHNNNNSSSSSIRNHNHGNNDSNNNNHGTMSNDTSTISSIDNDDNKNSESPTHSNNKALLSCAMTSMSSKIIGREEEHFAGIVVDACLAVKTVSEKTGKLRVPLKSINMLKAHGKGSRESCLLDGYALNVSRAAQGMPKRIENAKIACLDMNLQKTKMNMGVQVLVQDPQELEKIRQRELDITKERIMKIINAGANVVLTTKGIDDMSLKYFVDHNVIACRRVSKDDMRRIAKSTGATTVVSLADMDGEESFESSFLGSAKEVCEERISDDDIMMIKGGGVGTAVTILLRGANDYMLDEMDRSVHDALCVIKRVLESGSIVAGGGAVEAALSIYLEGFASTLGSREQLAIAEFAEAMLVIPKTLTVNAAKDATELVAKLRAYHNFAQSKPDKQHLKYFGLDLVNGTVRNNVDAGVIEPALIKSKIISLATEAAITVLRIDDMIKLQKEEQE